MFNEFNKLGQKINTILELLPESIAVLKKIDHKLGLIVKYLQMFKQAKDDFSTKRLDDLINDFLDKDIPKL